MGSCPVEGRHCRNDVVILDSVVELLALCMCLRSGRFFACALSCTYWYPLHVLRKGKSSANVHPYSSYRSGGIGCTKPASWSARGGGGSETWADVLQLAPL
eukprot:3088050-Amphidinium_carterae.1